MTMDTLSSGTPIAVARPAGDARRGLVVLPDAGGLTPNFERIAADLAERCHAAVAVVELFPGKEYLTFQERLASALGELREDSLLADVLEAADRLDIDPVAVLGVCIGGAMATRAATTGRFDRIVSLYGMVHLPEAWARHKGDPLDAVAGAATPVLAIVGTDDQFISGADLDELEHAGATVERVPGAKHGFAHDPGLPSHQPEAATEAWARVAEFLS